MYIAYRSYEDLSTLLLKNLYKIPHDIDTIVGIPRSGMIPALMISMYLNKPVTDLDSFIEGRLYSSGGRGDYVPSSQSSKVLVIDDSILTGNAILKAKEKIGDLEKNYNILYAAAYASSIAKKYVDLWFEEINMYRIFQWNIFHQKKILETTCMDIDGVLCPDPPYDDDGVEYVNFIQHASPMIIPSATINILVTCRLEKYRLHTERWLQEHGVKYDKLLMLNLPSKEERLKWGKHGEYKGEIYKKSSCSLFIESSLKEAVDICRVSGKQVFCIETMEMMYGNRQYLNKMSSSLNIKIRRLVKKLLPSSCIAKLKRVFSRI